MAALSILLFIFPAAGNWFVSTGKTKKGDDLMVKIWSLASVQAVLEVRQIPAAAPCAPVLPLSQSKNPY